MRLQGILRVVGAAFALLVASSASAEDGVWSVKKTSGEVWFGTPGVQQASVKSDEVLKPGETIRTGSNGRVLLVRGEESILIAPNSVIGIPSEKKDGLSTIIQQQAGSILLEVEKKNVKHFEVETPYLAAVVKGTQFRVTVSAAGAKVDVVRGQVEVADFKTGQIAQVMPGQHATAFSSGKAGLSLGGSGSLAPIQQGQPRASTIDRVPVPRNGLSAPNKAGSAALQQPRNVLAGAKHGVIRISSTLGEVRVNVQRVTHGLARSSGVVAGARSAAHRESTAWSSTESGSSGSVNNGNGNGGSGNGNSANSNNGNGNNGNGNGGGNGSGAVGNSGGNSGGGVSAGVSVGGGNAGGNGNGLALGVGNGSGNGLSVRVGGNGLSVGIGNGNGNGNGNGRGLALGFGNGNGNAFGRNR